jgi:hypothetical protein
MNELRGAARNLVPMRKSQQPKKTVKTAVRYTKTLKHTGEFPIISKYILSSKDLQLFQLR